MQSQFNTLALHIGLLIIEQTLNILYKSLISFSKDPVAGAVMSAAGIDCTEDYVLVSVSESSTSLNHHINYHYHCRLSQGSLS